jgi:hypothetical protein
MGTVNKKQQTVTSEGSSQIKKKHRVRKSRAWHEVNSDGSTCNHIGRKQIFCCLPVKQYCMHILEENEKGSAYQPPKCRDQNIDWLTKRWVLKVNVNEQ